MQKYLTLLFVLAAAALAGPANAINCERARTASERAICNSPALRAFDVNLSVAYAQVRKATSAEIFAEVRKSQLDWIRHRDRTCNAEVDCMIVLTQQRTAYLTAFAQRVIGQAPVKIPPEPNELAQIENHVPTVKLSPNEIYRAAANSIVVILAYGAGSENIVQGSGVVIGPSTVATNCHVISGTSNAVVIHLGRPHRILGSRGNQRLDACVVRTEPLQAAPARLASLATVSPGQRVYSIGSPRGLELTIAEGLVSALRTSARDVPSIQTSAPISPGSSGGGLFDEYGRVIGVTTSTLRDSQNLNFAIPIEELLRL